MNKLAISIIFLIASIYASAQPACQRSLQWFADNKFGMFIHWGLYSEAGGEWNGKKTRGGEHFMLYERIPLKEYAKLAEEFNPVEFNAEQWVRTAKEGGMKYIVITTKHHEGFAMYDSQCSDYNIVDATPFKRDPIKEIVDACRKEDLKIGFYYSLGRDWEDPDVPTNWPQKGGRSNTWDYPDEDGKSLPAYLKRKAIPQIKELLTNYGKIDFMWFDTPELVTKEQSKAIRKLIYELQPECLINDRIGNGEGDFKTVEQKLTDNTSHEPWEVNLTMGRNWGYNRYDTLYKKPDMIIRYLTDVVSKGGNMLLNVAPNGKGAFPKQTFPIIKELHAWMQTNGEAIYGTRPWRIYGEKIDPNQPDEEIKAEFDDAVFNGFPQQRTPDVRYTSKGNKVYIIVRHVQDKVFKLRAFTKLDKINTVKSLSGKQNVNWELVKDGLIIHTDNSADSYPIYVLEVSLKNT